MSFNIIESFTWRVVEAHNTLLDAQNSLCKLTDDYGTDFASNYYISPAESIHDSTRPSEKETRRLW